MAGGRPASQGFTLLEVLVVLAILAGLLAIVTPGFAQLYARIRMSLEQDDLEHQLLVLPEQARVLGSSGVLLGSETASAPEGEAARIADALATSKDARAGIEQWRLIHIDLPEGWSMQVAQPIIYHFTGVCDGGEVVFSLPPQTLTYTLTPPLCRPLPTHDASH